MRNLIASVAFLGLGAGTASADFLSSEEIATTIANKRVYLATPIGIEFPMKYAGNGQVTGDGTAIGLGRYFAPKETGRWWVSNDRMCQKFPTWYDGRTLCFKLQRTGDTTLNWFRDDGREGTARIAG